MNKSILAAVTAAVLCILTQGAGAMQSTNYRLDPMVIAAGGGAWAGTGLQGAGTLGQSTALGVAASVSAKTLAGFWHQLFAMIAGGDVDADGTLSLADAILALKAVSGLDTAGTGLTTFADADGNGRIDLPEALYVIQKMAGLR